MVGSWNSERLLRPATLDININGFDSGDVVGILFKAVTVSAEVS
jgi:hypothetical protein